MLIILVKILQIHEEQCAQVVRLHATEIDILILFGDVRSDQIEVRYLGLSLIGHGKTQNLIADFGKIAKDQNLRKLFQILIGGPNVNLKFLRGM